MSDFKLAHISDVHIGYTSTRIVTPQDINVREADGYLAFSACVTGMIEEGVDAVLVAGDIFHTPQPEIRSIIFVQNQLKRLSLAGISVYILCGNHDTNDVKSDVAASRLLHDPARNIYSHVEPYVKHEIGDGVMLHMVSHHMYSEQHETMSQINPVDGAVNIFSTHGSTIDPILQIRLHTEQSPREIVIPDFLMNDKEWDFTLLGHIHSRGYPGSEDGVSDTLGRKIFYNGSTIRRGFSDKECQLGRGWTLWNVKPDGVMIPEYKVVHQRPQLDFEIIDALDLSSSVVSEIVVDRLRETQLDGSKEFELATAPIIRQKIINLDPQKYASLDWAAINNNSNHALDWKLQQTAPEKKIESVEEIHENPHIDPNDIIRLYDGWVSRSNSLSSVEESLQEAVIKQTRDFVEQGQTESLKDR